MSDPNRWQPLALARNVAQNGLPVPGNVQRFVGSQWGHVSGVRPARLGRRAARGPRSPAAAR